MLNVVWVALIVIGVGVGLAGGRADVVTQASMESAEQAIKTLIGLLGAMIFWLGLARVAEEAGLVLLLARAMQPLLRRLFPSVPPEHPSLGSITMNLSANLLGLGSAATPFGLKAMQQLQELNPRKDTASDAMITFLVLNTAGTTLVPAFIIGLRAQYGSAGPAEILLPVFAATTCASVIGLLLDAVLRRRGKCDRK